VGILFIGSCFMSFSAVVGEGSDEYDYYFIEFDDYSIISEREHITQAFGVDFLEYHQDNTFLARINGDVLQQVKALPIVKSVVRYLPSQKIIDDLAGVTGVIKLRINLHDGVAVAGIADQLETMGAEIIKENTVVVNFIRCIIDASFVEEISSIKDVSWIQQEFEAQSFMNFIQTSQYEGQTIPQTFGFRGGGILTEVQDVGVELGHPDLVNVVWTDGVVSSNSHGTSVCGIMFGTGGGDIEARGIQYEGVGAYAQYNTGNGLTIANLWNGNFNEGPALMNGVVQTNSWWSGNFMSSEYDSYTNEIDQAAGLRKQQFRSRSDDNEHRIGFEERHQRRCDIPLGYCRYVR